jgi:hypothetical protein
MGNIFFCQIAEAFFSGLTNGTTPTTYSPSDSVPREQMAAFITRTQDSALRRGSRRAALKQWVPIGFTVRMQGTAFTGSQPSSVESDGENLWVANYGDGTVTKVHASDLRVLETWTGATNAVAVLVTSAFIFVAGSTSPGNLYSFRIDNAPGSVQLVSSFLGNFPQDITTDGTFIWTANAGGLLPGSGSVSKNTPDMSITTNFTAGFSQPVGILFDGSNVWVTDAGDNKLKKLDSNGNILQSVSVGSFPQLPVFDGSNIWVPNSNDNSITVVRARDGMVLATVTGNGLSLPKQAAFDGQRMLVTNKSGDSVSLWNAASLTPIGNASTGAGTGPTGVCSDGINFWIALQNAHSLAKF